MRTFTCSSGAGVCIIRWVRYEVRGGVKCPLCADMERVELVHKDEKPVQDKYASGEL